ncbi:helix-turn-helix transcriptional regulator [Eggerthella sp. NSJ-70]|uniref:Helix-turn-helix transcriptional regulator n=1 Tax=Eggerthella hominis TaxID=2763043 RepID=A0ABR7BVU1_9ACTN|nr:helix-turn-helix transcriptional regulator [Eggerthella hominis]MBC5585709.1 helix-turn-helix transcriptional regulator [Eggerthella hominis]
MRAWPAAKYLTYCFWRSWILVVYTAPIWSYVAAGTGAASCSFSMYAWSTVAFAAVAALLALFHGQASRLLSRKGVMCAAGIVSSVGMLMEYAGAFLFGGGGNPLFVIGALLTGVGTAFIAVRAGQIYAATRPVVAVTNTALSELASGLVFFFVVGTVPQIALLVAALLPLAAALMTLFEPDADEARMPARHRAAELDASTRRASVSAFVRFLVVVFLLTFMANLSKGAFALQDADASLASGTVGVSLVILVSFVLVLVSSLLKSFDFGVAYYPLVLMLVLAVVVVFSSDAGNMAAASVIVLVYCLFSLFMWCLLAYLARSDYWSPIQVFGWGRSVFALGSFAGLVVGQGYPALGLGESQSFVIGLVLAFLLVAASMLIFRESDVRKITSAGWLAVEAVAATPSRGDVGEAVGPVDATMRGDARDAGTGGAVGTVFGLDAETFAADHNLTVREREVFDLMLRGRDAKSIGEALVISDNTAKAHIRSIYAKTGVHTRQEFIDATEHVAR